MLDKPLLLTAKQVSELTNMSLSSVYRSAEEGILPVVKWGRATRFPRAGLLKWIQSNTEGGLIQRDK